MPALVMPQDVSSAAEVWALARAAAKRKSAQITKPNPVTVAPINIAPVVKATCRQKALTERSCIDPLWHSVPWHLYEQMPGIRPPVSLIKQVVCSMFDITESELCGPRRTQKYVKPRQIAITICCHLRNDLSFPKIGRAFGDRDHTTVLHTLRKLQPIVDRFGLSQNSPIHEWVSVMQAEDAPSYRRSIWTDELVSKLHRMDADQMSNEQIAIELGVPKGSVSAKRFRLAASGRINAPRQRVEATE